MDTLRRFRGLAFALLAVWLWGCDEETTVQPPPQPPQITLQRITGMANDDVFDVFVDSQSRLWVSTEAGVYMFPSSQGPFPDPADATKVKWFTDRDGIPNLRCRGVNELNGKVFVGTWGGGIGIYSDGPRWEAVRPADGLLNGRVFELAPDDTSMWLATVDGVGQYLDNGAPDVRDRLVDRTDIFGAGKFSSITVVTGVGGNSDSGEVWVSVEIGEDVGVPVPGGIKFLGLPGAVFQSFQRETSGIPSDDVAEVVYDPTRNLVWSAHPGNGVATVDLGARTWRTYTTGDGLVSDLAGSVAVNRLGTQWPAGTVWIATQAGLTKMEPGGNMVNYAWGSGLPTLRVRRVVVDRNDDVWLCLVDRGAAKVVPPGR